MCFQKPCSIQGPPGSEPFLNNVASMVDSVKGFLDLTKSFPLTDPKPLISTPGVPGMVGGMLRHMKSLRTMKRDHGFIHTLLEDAPLLMSTQLNLIQHRQNPA